MQCCGQYSQLKLCLNILVSVLPVFASLNCAYDLRDYMPRAHIVTLYIRREPQVKPLFFLGVPIHSRQDAIYDGEMDHFNYENVSCDIKTLI